MVLVIVGPTAAGKSTLSMICARRLGAEIVNADSRQVYRGMDIGTDKPNRAKRQEVKHHLLDHVDPDMVYSAGAYASDAHKCILGIMAGGKRAIIVGGSGLYIKAVIDGFADLPKSDSSVRRRLEKQLQKEGADSLYRELARVDPATARKIDARNPHRLMRALEVYQLSGLPPSELYRESRGSKNAWDFFQVGLLWERKRLYERIDSRVDSMLEDGLVEEVRHLTLERKNPPVAVSRSVGYKEVLDFLRGSISHDEMRSAIKKHTRNFAKRQMTWFRKDERIHWFSVDSEDELSTIARHIEEKLLARERSGTEAKRYS